ncbi:hypothetical protein J3R82DRAFT_5486 [Butyriboletus roseoflavus]|nr:hypothetical protein J3R82DRAFT_5486 [Butyriboletus roseoflavus]
MTSHDEVAVPPSSQDQQGSPFYAALARTTTRAITLYFSRPVRLFRPSKGESNTMKILSANRPQTQ